MTHAHQRLNGLVRDLITEAAEAGDVREDVAPAELARYCVHALAPANGLPSKAAVERLVAVTLAACGPLQPPDPRPSSTGAPAWATATDAM